MSDIFATLSVTEAKDQINELLEQALPALLIEGEVSGYKVSKNTWVFFDIKDENCSINCFLPISKLTVALEDGMRIKMVAEPKLTNWGRFSLTVRNIQLQGEGAINKSYELLKEKLKKQGLFDSERKRLVGVVKNKVGVVTSLDSSGWQDFKKVVDERAAGLQIDVVDVKVQGIDSPQQIIKAVKFFNEQPNPPEVIAIIRGGGSLQDLSGFNDEALAKTIATSKIPVVTGVGHEDDEVLADLVADQRFATPTHVATSLTFDKKQAIQSYKILFNNCRERLSQECARSERLITNFLQTVQTNLNFSVQKSSQLIEIFKTYSPNEVLRKGYAILSSNSEIKVGSDIMVTTYKQHLKAEVKDVKNR